MTAEVADAGAPTAGRLTGSADVTAPVGKDDAGMLLVGSTGRPVVGDTGNAPAAASAVAGAPVTVLALGNPPLPPGKADVTGASAVVTVDALGAPPPVGRDGTPAGKLGTPPPVGRPGLLTVMTPPVFELRLAALELVVSVSGPWLIVSLRGGAALVTGSSALPAVATTPLTCEGGGGVPTLVPAAETVTPLGEAETSNGTLADPPLARFVTWLWTVPAGPGSAGTDEADVEDVAAVGGSLAPPKLSPAVSEVQAPSERARSAAPPSAIILAVERRDGRYNMVDLKI